MQHSLHSHNEVSMQRLLSVANASLLISVLVLAVTVLVCYPYAEFFSLLFSRCNSSSWATSA